MFLHHRWMVEEVFVTKSTEVNFFKKNKDKYYAIILGDSAFVPTPLYRKALKEMNGVNLNVKQ